MSEEIPSIQLINLGKTYSTNRNLPMARRTAANVFVFFRKVTGYGGERVVALDNVNLQVNKGEVVGLLGPNGAGKTTLIKILSTLVLPDTGKALVDGIDVTKHPRTVVRHLQTVLSESIGFDRRLTGRSSLEFYAELLGVPKKVAKQRIDELLEFTGMTEWADVMFQRYSTGMMRRFLVCRALLSNASILLFDEPTAALDPISAADFRSLLKNNLAKKAGKTILIATHNLYEAEQICDRIALLRKGKIIAVGTPAEIKAKVSDRLTVTVLVSNFLPELEKAAIESLESVRGVQSAEIIENYDDDGHTRIHIEANRSLDYNDVFAKLMGMKFEIISVESSQPSLEDAFLKLNLEAAS